VKNRFQTLPFKCNLQRYNEVAVGDASSAAAAAEAAEAGTAGAGAAGGNADAAAVILESEKEIEVVGSYDETIVVGLCTLNQVDP
jgi:hypothetical protein